MPASLGNYKEALDIFNKSIKAVPGVYDTHNNIAYTLQVLDRDKEALTHCNRAIEINPRESAAHNNKGNSVKEAWEISGSRRVLFNRAIELSPRFGRC